jgi:hypothetical protein
MPAKLADDGGNDRQTISSRFGDTDGVITSSKGRLVAGLPCPRHCEAGRLSVERSREEFISSGLEDTPIPRRLQFAHSIKTVIGISAVG